MLEATKLLGVNCIARRARSKAGCNDGKKSFSLFLRKTNSFRWQNSIFSVAYNDDDLASSGRKSKKSNFMRGGN